MQSLEDSDYLRDLQYLEPREIGAFAAVHFCELNGLRVPAWAVAASMRFMADTLLGAPKARGRSNHPVARYHEALIHKARHVEFEDVLSRRDELAASLPDLETRRATPPKGMATQYTQRRWLEGSRDHLYRCTSVKLRGTYAAGTPEQVKTSVKFIEDNTFVELRGAALKELGLMSPNQLLQDVPPAAGVQRAKTVPFYELPV